MCPLEPVDLVTEVWLELSVPPLELDVGPCEGHELSCKNAPWQIQQDPQDANRRRMVGTNNEWSTITFKEFDTL